MTERTYVTDKGALTIRDDAASASSGSSTSNGNTTSKPSSTSSAQLLAANASRKGVSILNTDANPLFLLYATSGSASATNLSDMVASGERVEVPFGYTGAIQGAWGGATGQGAAFMTEFT